MAEKKIISIFVEEKKYNCYQNVSKGEPTEKRVKVLYQKLMR